LALHLLLHLVHLDQRPFLLLLLGPMLVSPQPQPQRLELELHFAYSFYWKYYYLVEVLQLVQHLQPVLRYSLPVQTQLVLLKPK
jgi:hypothetical protein